MEVAKYARKCDVTKKGMNEGYCFGDGAWYCASLEDAIAEVKKDVNRYDLSWENTNEEGEKIIESFDEYHEFSRVELLSMNDDDRMNVAYGNGYYYYTEWDEIDDDDYYLEDGTNIQNQN